jgi:glycosyltransferase involved in cell wall biosynthesis
MADAAVAVSADVDHRTTSPPMPEVSVMVIGTLVPDTAEFHGPAFNRAGQMFQASLVRGLIDAGLPVTTVLSVEPVAAFPRQRRLLGRRGLRQVPQRLRVRLVPFINVQPLKALSAGLSVAWHIIKWAWRHRRRRRIVHLFNMTMPPGAFVWLAARLAQCHLSVSALDVWKPGALVPDTWRWRLDFLLQRTLLPRFDGHMVVSRAIADDLIPGRRVCLLEGGIDETQFQVARAERSDRDRFRMVLSGSLADFNGVDLMLAAMDHLPPDIELVVAGTGPLAGRVTDRAARDPRVRYAGFLSFAEVLALYRNADLLLNIRLTQAIDTRYFFPSKLMELLASGTPVLSTCTGQVEADYGHALFLLRDETPEALADAIRAIRTLPPAHRAQVGREAHAFMLREKTWTRQGQRLTKYLLREVGRLPHG